MSGVPPLLPPDLAAGLRLLEIELGRPVRLRLVREESGGEPCCRLVDRGQLYELRCHDPSPGYFWHHDAVRRFLSARAGGDEAEGAE